HLRALLLVRPLAARHAVAGARCGPILPHLTAPKGSPYLSRAAGGRRTPAPRRAPVQAERKIGVKGTYPPPSRPRRRPGPSVIMTSLHTWLHQPYDHVSRPDGCPNMIRTLVHT